MPDKKDIPPHKRYYINSEPFSSPLLTIDFDCLKGEQVAPCDLFLKTGPRRYTLFAQKGLSFAQDTRRHMLERGVSTLCIHEHEAPLYFAYVNEALRKAVRSPNISASEKAAIVHASCRDIMDKVFEDPRAPFLDQVHKVITPTVEMVVKDKNATKRLIQLTSHDHATYVHSTNVGIFSIALARLIYGEDSKHDLEKLAAGFFLHDLGKCRVPTEIINKPGSLDKHEKKLMQQHPTHGYEMLLESGHLSEEARIITLQHHERNDGEGYPNQLTRCDIHPYAHICRLADVYDAMTSIRPYHRPFTTFEALKLMQKQVLKDIDKDLFAHFVQLFTP